MFADDHGGDNNDTDDDTESDSSLSNDTLPARSRGV